MLYNSTFIANGIKNNKIIYVKKCKHKYLFIEFYNYKLKYK